MMIKKYFFVIVLIMLVSCKPQDDSTVMIAAAANMQFAIKEIATAFTLKTGIDCEVITSSSGKLTAQIIEGAPYDIFISADMKYPNTLFDRGFTTTPPKIYGYGQLVLWSQSKNIHPTLNILTSKEIQHIALANPKTAPYGKAAISVLKNAKKYQSTKQKLVYGESISQTNQFVISGAAEIGFTAKSIVLSSKVNAKENWTAIDNHLYNPIKQGVVLLKKDTINTASSQFYNFLFSKKSQEILENFGYLVPSN